MLKITLNKKTMRYGLFSIVIFLVSLNGFSQFDSKLIVGKWKLISGINSNTSINYQVNDQYYVEYFSNGTFKQTHKRNEKLSKGRQVKGTFYNVGKWRLVDSTVLMYDRRPDPPLRVFYGDYTDTLISLTASELYIISALPRGAEGETGTLFYKRVKGD